MLLGVQVPGFPVGFGGMINMSMVESMGQLHHAGPHPHHPTSVVGAPAPHLPHHPHHPHHHHHPRLHAARASPAADDARSPGHSPTALQHRPRSPALPPGAPPAQPAHPTTAASMGGGHGGPRSDRYAPYNRLAQVQIHPPRNPNKPLTPFSISDILTGRAADAAAQRRKAQEEGGESADRPGGGVRRGGGGGGQPGVAAPRPANNRNNYLGPLSIVRPWDDVSSTDNRLGSPLSDRCDESEEDSEEEIEVDDDPNQTKLKLKVNSAQSPLDALLQMTSKTFDGMDASAAQSDDTTRRDQLSLFSKSQPAKKRRKSRTAFTNQQIYELEKRFLYQKYLTPADRDEIASSLGLTNAQVITWFQNRRAKLKRDLEELKADVTAASSVSPGVAPDLESVHERHHVFGSLDELKMLQKTNGGPGGAQGAGKKIYMPTPLESGGVNDKASSSGNASGDDASSNDAATSPRCMSPVGVTSRPVSPQQQQKHTTSPEQEQGEPLKDKDSEEPQKQTLTSS